jgi:hypothetical protein
LGGDPLGFTSQGSGNVLSASFSGWRNRAGTYTSFIEDDAIDTIVECIDKTRFKPAHQYAQLVPEARPRYELLTTYSRIKLARRILQAGNDNIGSSLDKYKDTVTIRGVPMVPVWAWSNQEFGTTRTDGLVLGVNWRCFKYVSADGLKRVKRAPYQDANKHNVRWRVMDDSGQLICLDRRAAGFAVNSTVAITESD